MQEICKPAPRVERAVETDRAPSRQMPVSDADSHALLQQAGIRSALRMGAIRSFASCVREGRPPAGLRVAACTIVHEEICFCRETFCGCRRRCLYDRARGKLVRSCTRKFVFAGKRFAGVDGDDIMIAAPFCVCCSFATLIMIHERIGGGILEGLMDNHSASDKHTHTHTHHDCGLHTARNQPVVLGIRSAAAAI